jgi:GDPmannose 4,6-dehydratase
MKPSALVTGATGQDGSYLVDLLLSKGYSVVCIVRRTSSPTRVIQNPNVHVVNGDLTDFASLITAVNIVKDSEVIEIYNLAAQSHVGISFKCPQTTSEINYLGTLNLLEAIRQSGIINKVRFYQASTSEMFGKVQQIPQNEQTPFYPRSPYGVSKLAAHWIVKNYRESYDLFACCGILFNHESPRRGMDFVTQKIVHGLYTDGSRVLKIGNLDARRDWGHARDYVEAMWLMLQQSEPDDYVVATGVQHSVREFVEAVASPKQIRWTGTGINEKGYIDNKLVVEVDEEFYRPCEVDTLIGDASKIKNIGWKPNFTFQTLVDDMKEKKIKTN